MHSFRPKEKPFDDTRQPTQAENTFGVPASTGVLIDIIDKIKLKEKQQKAGGSQFKDSASSDKIGVYLHRVLHDVTEVPRVLYFPLTWCFR